MSATPQQVLDLELGQNDAGARTVRDYLVRLLSDVWKYGESFNGKRPFGNSSWEYDLYEPLIKAGYVPGTLDADGYVDTFDQPAADALVAEAIKSLGHTGATQP